jgi:hypothetical protein
VHFDLTDLRLFAAVVEEGSITVGASRAGRHPLRSMQKAKKKSAPAPRDKHAATRHQIVPRLAGTGTDAPAFRGSDQHGPTIDHDHLAGAVGFPH